MHMHKLLIITVDKKMSSWLRPTSILLHWSGMVQFRWMLHSKVHSFLIFMFYLTSHVSFLRDVCSVFQNPQFNVSSSVPPSADFFCQRRYLFRIPPWSQVAAPLKFTFLCDPWFSDQLPHLVASVSERVPWPYIVGQVLRRCLLLYEWYLYDVSWQPIVSLLKFASSMWPAQMGNLLTFYQLSPATYVALLSAPSEPIREQAVWGKRRGQAFCEHRRAGTWACWRYRRSGSSESHWLH